MGKYVNAIEASEILNVSKMTISKWVKNGKLNTIHPKTLMFKKSEVYFLKDKIINLKSF